MKHNQAFWRAINSFLHPVTIAAVLLLIVNDHWLRWQHPSWLTGKLGDFTWLIFAPFVAAACFAWLLPRRLKNHEKIVGWLAFGVIGLWFTLAKTTAPVHEITVRLWEALIGWQGTQRMDSGDLLALVGLAVGWWVFWRVDNQRFAFRPAASILFALGIVGTLASDRPLYQFSDSGITQICLIDSKLVTVTETAPIIRLSSPPTSADDMVSDDPSKYDVTPQYFVYYSDDGGLRWSSTLSDTYLLQEADCPQLYSTLAIDPNNELIQYRWERGESIERSTDGGQTWTLDHELVEVQQDVRSYYNHYSVTDYYGYDIRTFHMGPVTGIVDPGMGNLVLAMSWDGVLVRTPTGKWQWVALGTDYRLADLNNFNKLIDILFYELWLAGALVFLVVTTSTAYLRYPVIRWRRLRFTMLSVGWVGWLVLTIGMLVRSLGIDGDRYTLGLAALPILVLIGIPLTFAALWDIAWNFRPFAKHIFRIAFGVGLLFIAPFIPWTQGTIPRYTTALNFALFLAGAGLLAGFIYLRERLPVLDKPKRRGKVIETEPALPLPFDAPPLSHDQT